MTRDHLRILIGLLCAGVLLGAGVAAPASAAPARAAVGTSVATSDDPTDGPPVDPPPSDSDGDGIDDGTDACPFEPGVPESYGCPYVGPTDADGDGVDDTTDQCPTDPGPATYQGCPPPDSDGDGLTDDADACPTLPGPYDGCPLTDLDGDGVWDDTDQCPNQAGSWDHQGCPAPDTDGDGVPDAGDLCSDTPTGETVDATGCTLAPEPAPGTTTVTPRAPTFTDSCGTRSDTVRIPRQAGVLYHRGSMTLGPGTYPVADGSTVVATALDGYLLSGVRSWTASTTTKPCPRGRVSVIGDAAGRVRIVNREDSTMRVQVAGISRTVRPGATVTVTSRATTRSARVRWSASWDGPIRARAGWVRLG